MPDKRTQRKLIPGRKRTCIPVIRLGDGEGDRAIADWMYECQRQGKPPSVLIRLMLAAVLTGTNPLTNRPLTVNTLKNILTGEGYTNEDDGTDEDDDYTPILRFKD